MLTVYILHYFYVFFKCLGRVFDYSGLNDGDKNIPVITFP